MPADHLSARQAAYTTIAQHTLNDLSTGILYRTGIHSNGTWVDWPARQAQSTIWLPRSGQAGVWLDNEKINLASPGGANVQAQDMTVECVATCQPGLGYNFFGGVWQREIMALCGYFAYNLRIWHMPVNDSVSDTQGRFVFDSYDVGQNLIASKTVHSRPVVSDDRPHHVCFTAKASTTTDAVKLYVDGVKTETYTLKGNMGFFQPSPVYINVEDFFTSNVGSTSHVCVTAGILTEAEIAARANLVTGGKLTDQGSVMSWDATNNTWRSFVKGRSSSSWYVTRPPA